MPDRKPQDLTQTGIEKMTGMVDPYAEAIREADRRREEEAKAQAEETRQFNADHGDYM